MHRNKRASKMWFYMNGHVDFADKQVLDLGCGYGDFVSLCLDADALYVTGVERDYIIASYASTRLAEEGHSAGDYQIIVDDIDRIVKDRDLLYSGYDIIVCTSVLPYLDDPEAALMWIRGNSSIAIIECQYAGDGPGPEGIANDKEMMHVLYRSGWRNVQKIGYTDVVIRPAKRSIWKCYD